MYFLKIEQKAKSDAEYVAGVKRKNYRQRVNKCNQETMRFLSISIMLTGLTVITDAVIVVTGKVNTASG